MKKRVLLMTAALLLIGSLPAYAAAVKYVLTEFARPLLVNGVPYESQSLPILNHGGNTWRDVYKEVLQRNFVKFTENW